MYKKILFSSLILGLMFFNVSLGAEEEISTMNIDATVNSDIEPDTLKVKFYVENSGINLSDIKDKNDKIVNQATNEIKKRLKENETIKTIAFRVSNIYSYKNSVRIFQKYSVTNGFEVKLKDLSKASEIIKIAMDNGVKRVDGLNFYIENSQKSCNDLMSQAIKIAKTRADIIAQSAGANIYKVKSINPYCSLNSTYVTRSFQTNALMAKSTGSSDSIEEAIDTIEPGTINVRAGVNMVYYLK